jgi:hypothetical protein
MSVLNQWDLFTPPCAVAHASAHTHTQTNKQTKNSPILLLSRFKTDESTTARTNLHKSEKNCVAKNREQI